MTELWRESCSVPEERGYFRLLEQENDAQGQVDGGLERHYGVHSPCCALIFIFAYPAVRVFYFHLSYPAVHFIFTYPAVRSFYFRLTTLLYILFSLTLLCILFSLTLLFAHFIFAYPAVHFIFTYPAAHFIFAYPTLL